MARLRAHGVTGTETEITAALPSGQNERIAAIGLTSPAGKLIPAAFIIPNGCACWRSCLELAPARSLTPAWSLTPHLELDAPPGA